MERRRRGCEGGEVEVEVEVAGKGLPPRSQSCAFSPRVSLLKVASGHGGVCACAGGDGARGRGLGRCSVAEHPRWRLQAGWGRSGCQPVSATLTWTGEGSEDRIEAPGKAPALGADGPLSR